MESLGRYTLLRRIGKGGMGEIWKARVEGPEGFQKTLALKTVLPELAEDRQFISMFIEEAKLSAQLVHPNIVQVFDFGQISGRYFLAMELVVGTNLSRLLSRLSEAGRVLPLELAIYVAFEAVRGLGYAHSRDIVHRDVSPHNLVLSVEGDVKVTDFGIARATSVISHTLEGHVRGKAAFMSPEQARGERVDRRSDLFSLGLVLWEMVTGKRFLAGPMEEVLPRLLALAPLTTEELIVAPEPMREILARALHPDREERFQEAGEMEAELGQMLGLSGVNQAGQALGRVVKQLFADELSEDLEVGAAAARTSSPLISQANIPTVAEAPPGDSPTPLSRRTLLIGLGGAACLATGLGVGLRRSGIRRGGVLGVAMGDDASDFNLYSLAASRSRWALEQVTEKFLESGQDGEATDGVLARWASLEGGRRLVLELRPGVWFRDHPCFAGGKGRLATGADLASSLRVFIKEVGAPFPVAGAAEYQAGAPALSGIAAEGMTLTVSLSEPAPFFEAALESVALIPQELEASGQSFRRLTQPVGTGPFRFTEAPRTSRMEMVRSDRYWREGKEGRFPFLDGLVFRQGTDVASTLAAMRTGEVGVFVPARRDWDAIADFSVGRPRLAAAWAQVDADLATYTTNNYLSLFGLLVLRHKGPLEDPRLAQAVAWALDRPAIVAATQGAVSMAYGRFLAPGLLGFDPAQAGYGLDLAKARSLLAAAGHPAGSGLPEIVIATLPYGRAAEVVRDQLGVIGLRVRVIQMGSGEADPFSRRADVDALLGTDHIETHDGEAPDLLYDLRRYGNVTGRMEAAIQELFHS